MVKEFDRWHIRSYDKKRLISKIGSLGEADFESLNILIHRLFAENMKTPVDGVSEAEARGFTEIPQGVPYMRSIEEQKLLSRFFGNLYPYHLTVAQKL